MRRLGGLAVLALLLAVSPVLADDAPLHGVALVIGQSDYTGTLPKLENPKNDASAMSQLLGELGFSVTTAVDDNQAKLTTQLTDFETAAKGADVALVYYSGHGIEAGGENYLVPTDADLSSPSKAGATLVPVSAMLDELAKTVPVTIVLLDACRSNAFPAGTMIQPPGAPAPIAAQSTGLGELRGPAPVAKPGVSADNLGMVIGFAASPGQPALDGAPGDKNSPYAAALLKHLAAGGYSFGDVMTMVSEEVYLKTKARQLPWVNSSLRRVLSFGKPVETADADQAAIRKGRRDLLLTIAGAPDAAKQTVETVASNTDVPLDKVYTVLKALGVDTSDPSQLSQQLTDGAKRVKKLESNDSTPVVTTDDDITKLVALASQADDEGATDAALDFWNRASARAKDVSASLGDNADDQHKLLARIYSQNGDAAFLAFDLPTAVDRYADAAEEVASIDEGLANQYKRSQADALEQIGEYKGDNDAFDKSLHLYDEVMTYLDSQSDDDLWADTENDFGEALVEYGDRQKSDEYLTDAKNAFEQVIKIWTRDKKPDDWARAQINLANVHASLGDRSRDPQEWQQAIDGYNSALEVWTADANPDDWARTHNNLGTVYRALGNYEGKDGNDDLKNAIAAEQAALTKWTKDESGFDWAMAQQNLANATGDLAKATKNTKGIEASIDAYTAALDVYTREVAPLQWADVQNGIGASYMDLSRLQKGGDAQASLRQSIEAYNLCLEERTQDNDPRDWALTQYNVGLVETELGQLGKDAEAWQQAAGSFTASLEVYTQDDSPADWADAQEGLGWADANLGALNGDRDLIEQGKTAMQNAADYYQDQNGSQDYYADKLKKIDKLLKAAS